MESAATKLRREGRREGLVEGRVEGRAELLLAQLRARFGPLPAAIAARVAAADEEDARRWALGLLEAHTLEEVLATAPPRE